MASEEVRELSQKATPRSEQRRSAWGSLLLSNQTVKGLCARTSKCVKRDGHDGSCWPTQKE